MMHTFKDKEQQELFEQNGYVVLPLLHEAQLTALRQLYTAHEGEYSQPFHTTHFSQDTVYKKKVNDTITAIVAPALQALLNDYRPVFANFMIKHGMNDAFMPMHADWTYVDESKYRSVAAWISLVDVTEENGCFGVIRGTHRVSAPIRGPRIQQTSYQHDKDWVKAKGELLPMPAGSVIIFDHALLHYSPPNRTEVTRPALNISLVPAEARVMHYCIPEGANDIEVYAVEDNDFYIRYNNYQRPETGTLTGTIPAQSVGYIDDRMQQFMRPEVRASAGGWLAALKQKLFSGKTT